MPASVLSGLAEGKGPLREICLSLPAKFLSDNDVAGAADALSHLASMIDSTGRGLLPTSKSNNDPDIFASLWFIRAAHLFGKAALTQPALADPALFPSKFLPISKKILQVLISEQGIGGVRMDDGGLLIPPPGPAAQTLRLNALWYSALESTAADLKAVHDPVADHFERLAGRFRRSFAKAYWCDTHACICTPEARALPDHGDLPDPDQLLLTLLPASPIPRTKQRQLLQHLRNKALGDVGLLVHHPKHGIVESPMHLAWLALGMIATADPPAAGITEAAPLLERLQPLRPEAHARGIPAWYLHGKPLPREPISPMTTAEVLGALKNHPSHPAP